VGNVTRVEALSHQEQQGSSAFFMGKLKLRRTLPPASRNIRGALGTSLHTARS